MSGGLMTALRVLPLVKKAKEQFEYNHKNAPLQPKTPGREFLKKS